MKMENYCHLNAEDTAVSGVTKQLAVRFSQTQSGHHKIGGKHLIALEAGTLRNFGLESPEISENSPDSTARTCIIYGQFSNMRLIP